MAKIDENYFNVPSSKQATQVEDILEEDETVLVRLHSDKRACFLEAFLKLLPIVIIWLAVDGVGAYFAFTATELPLFAKILIGVFMLFHLMPVWIWLYGIYSTVVGNKNLEYVFTEKRVIIRSGIVGIDFKTIYYSDIAGVNCKVGFLEKRFHVGDVYIQAATQSAILNNIPDPYHYMTRLHQITADIKSDIYYPNNLRPEENHGYRTKYSR